LEGFVGKKKPERPPLTKRLILKELQEVNEALQQYECWASNRCPCCAVSSLVGRLELEQLRLKKRKS
jgi:hypothetical protein